MKLSICFYPNVLKANRKTGKTPLYLRVVLDRQKAEKRLNIEVNVQELKKWDEGMMRFSDRKILANRVLNRIESKFDEFKYNNATDLSNFNVKMIRDLLMGLNTKQIPLIKVYISKYYESAVESNEQISQGTKRNYRKTINHLNVFLAERKMENFTLKEVNSVFALEFRDYLLKSNFESGKVGMKEASALDNVKKLRTIFDRAVDEGYLLSNPFKKIKLKAKSARRGRLDIHQVKRLYNLDLSQFPIQQLYLDIFLFSVFTGLSYADSNSLKQSDLYETTDGNIRLLLNRAKTQVITEMILPQQAINVIEKYKCYPEIAITGKVLPGRSNKEVNVQLKILANMAGIPLKLSTHIARHTFRQLLSEADIFETAVIKRLMGHSRSNDIDDVYYAVTESRLLMAKTKFESYLKQSLL